MRAGFDDRRRMGQLSGAGPRRRAPVIHRASAQRRHGAGGCRDGRRRRSPTACTRRLRAATKSGLASLPPITGPASAYGVIGKVMAAYADKVNAEGGINGRKLNLITYDDAYDPNKTMEMTRKLVEEDQVLLTMATIGTNTNAAIQPYLNSKKVPQLFVLSGAAAWDQPREFPWTMGFLPSYAAEAQIYAQYLLENHPRSKIAVLYQDDGMGKEYLKGLKDGLAGKIPIVAEAYIQGHGHHHRSAARQAQGLGRRRLHASSPRRNSRPWRSSESPNSAGSRCISSPSIANSYSAVTSAGGPAKCGRRRCRRRTGWRAKTRRRPATRRSANGAPSCSAMSRASASPTARPSSAIWSARLIVEVLKNCGDDLSRENIMKQARSLKGLQLPMMVPGIQINTSASRPCADRADADDALHQRPLAVLRPGAKRHRSGHRQRFLQDDLQVRHRHQARSGEPAQRQYREPDDRLVRLAPTPRSAPISPPCSTTAPACGSCR